MYRNRFFTIRHVTASLLLMRGRVPRTSGDSSVSPSRSAKMTGCDWWILYYSIHLPNIGAGVVTFISVGRILLKEYITIII